MSESTKYPYAALGQKLKAARERLKKSLAEASGAVEINESALQGIELGQKRPAQDTLMVLISYLGFKDEEATKVWELAGYHDQIMTDDSEEATVELNQQLAMVMPGDLRVVYTDMVHVLVNDFGVVMNFLQGAGPNSQPLAIARVGMSKEHARSVLEILDKSLKQSDKRAESKLLESKPKTTRKPSAKKAQPKSDKSEQA